MSRIIVVAVLSFVSYAVIAWNFIVEADERDWLVSRIGAVSCRVW